MGPLLAVLRMACKDRNQTPVAKLVSPHTHPVFYNRLGEQMGGIEYGVESRSFVVSFAFILSFRHSIIHSFSHSSIPSFLFSFSSECFCLNSCLNLAEFLCLNLSEFFCPNFLFMRQLFFSDIFFFFTIPETFSGFGSFFRFDGNRSERVVVDF